MTSARTIITAMLAALAFGAGACAPGDDATDAGAAATMVDVAAEEQAIRDADAAWLQAAQNLDAQAFAAAFAPDGRLLFPHAPAAEGRAAIQEKAAADFQAPGFQVSWSTQDVEIAEAGDLAYATGSYELSMETPDGPMQDQGKFLTVWEKIDGQWLVAADMIATDTPPPGAAGQGF